MSEMTYCAWNMIGPLFCTPCLFLCYICYSSQHQQSRKHTVSKVLVCSFFYNGELYQTTTMSEHEIINVRSHIQAGVLESQRKLKNNMLESQVSTTLSFVLCFPKLFKLNWLAGWIWPAVHLLRTSELRHVTFCEPPPNFEGICLEGPPYPCVVRRAQHSPILGKQQVPVFLIQYVFEASFQMTRIHVILSSLHAVLASRSCSTQSKLTNG